MGDAADPRLKIAMGNIAIIASTKEAGKSIVVQGGDQ
jgi:hypothetical protein